MLNILASKIDDDSIDRINHIFTTLFLFLCAIISSKRQYIGNPISCWTPKDFISAHNEYAENICWTKNTYFVDINEKIPLHHSNRKQAELNYYQWVPFLLLIQAMLFQVPNLLWTIFYANSGINVRHIVEKACFSENTNPHSRKKCVKVITRLLEQSIEIQREYRETCCTRIKAGIINLSPLWCSKKLGNFLCTLYTFVKLLYIANVISQIYLMNQYLGGSSSLYGFYVAWNLTRGFTWEESRIFPRTTLCDFQIRTIGNVQNHTIQCVLPINRLNEKIYVVLWFWFFVVASLTIINFVKWCTRYYCRFQRLNRTYSLLLYCGVFEHAKLNTLKKSIDSFVDNYLKLDGIFIILLIEHNAGKLIASEIISKLWQRHLRNQNRDSFEFTTIQINTSSSSTSSTIIRNLNMSKNSKSDPPAFHISKNETKLISTNEKYKSQNQCDDESVATNVF